MTGLPYLICVVVIIVVSILSIVFAAMALRESRAISTLLRVADEPVIRADPEPVKPEPEPDPEPEEREIATAWVGIRNFDMGDCVGLVNGEFISSWKPVVRVVGMSSDVDATIVVDRETAARLMADDRVRMRLALIEVRDDGEGD